LNSLSRSSSWLLWSRYFVYSEKNSIIYITFPKNSQ
jgi:hypothetical protein